MAIARALAVAPRAWSPEERARRRAGPLLAQWLYVDEARTHQVDARFVREGDAFAFRVRETAFGATDPRESLESSFSLRDAWEARFHQADLEARLAECGAYWRREPPATGWSRVRRNPSLPRIDLRPMPVRGAGFHHFHDSRGARDRLLVSMPSRAPQRFRLADLRFRFPHVEEGTLDLVHASLPPGPLRGLLSREHLAMAAEGFEKLTRPADFAMAFGADWRHVVQAVFEGALERVEMGRLGAPGRVEPAPPVDPVITPYDAAFKDPRLAAVHRRFLRPGEEDQLLQVGVAPIRRAIAAKRRETPHEEQHLLTVLEASLLARYAFRWNEEVDAEAARVLRRLDYYL